MSASDAASYSLPLRNCYWVVPGLLLAGEHPNGPTRDKTKDRLKKLLDAGIECFVDLTKPTELLRYDTFLPFYVEYTRKSIKDHSIPGARSQMVEILEHIATSMRAGRPVYVHCRAGIGRTGTVVGCLLAERGMQGQATIDELNRLWQQCRRSRSWPFIPETDAQAQYVREWQPSLDGGFELSSLATAVATVGSMSAHSDVRGTAGPRPGTAVGPRTGARPAGAAAFAVGGNFAGAAGSTAGGSFAGAAGSAAGGGFAGGAGSTAGGTPAGAAASTAGVRSAGVAGGRSAGAAEPAGVGSRTGATGPGGVDRRAGAGSPRVGRGPNGAMGSGSPAGAFGSAAGVGRPGGASGPAGAGANGQTGVVSAAGRPSGIGAGLRAAAEQARAAVARGEVQVKAPPVPTAAAGPAATPIAARGRAVPVDSTDVGRSRTGPVDATDGGRGRTVPADTTDAAGGRTVPADATDGGRGRTVPADRTDAARGRTVPADATDAARGRTVPAGTTGAGRGETPGVAAAGANALRGADAPNSPSPSAGPVTGAGDATPPVELERGAIAPSIRAEIADAIAGRAPSWLGSGASAAFPPGQVTASPNGGEEAPWAVSAPASASDTVRARIPAQPSAGPRADVEPPGPGSLAAAAVEPAPTTALGQAGAEQMAAARAAVASELAGSRAGVASELAGSRGPNAVEPSPPARGQAAAEPMAAAGAAVASELAGSRGLNAVEPSPAARGQAGAEQMAAARAAVASELAGSRAAAAAETPATARNSAAASQSAAAAPAPPATPPVEQPADPDPLLDPDTLAAARGLRERFLGTMFGLAIGDAVAAATQFRRPGTFSPIGDMLGGGPFDLPRGAWSDDTAMALCLAESLLERDGFDARDQVQRYSRWQQDGYLTSTGQCVGITANTARSLALAKWRRGMVFPGSHDPEQLDPEPLSRIASIALFYFASLESTQQQAVDSSRITCQAPAVLDACRRLSRALNAALAGQPKTKILAEGGPVNEATVQANNTAAAALNTALWAFSATGNFRDAVLCAANVGGNSDVVATVVGQLAGAHYGASAIPVSWRSGLIQKDLIEGIADRLLAHALVSLSS